MNWFNNNWFGGGGTGNTTSGHVAGGAIESDLLEAQRADLLTMTASIDEHYRAENAAVAAHNDEIKADTL